MKLLAIPLYFPMHNNCAVAYVTLKPPLPTAIPLDLTNSLARNFVVLQRLQHPSTTNFYVMFALKKIDHFCSLRIPHVFDGFSSFFFKMVSRRTFKIPSASGKIEEIRENKKVSENIIHPHLYLYASHTNSTQRKQFVTIKFNFFNK